ncbi:G patch domain-containing protein 1 homolog [Phlebotomus argentipes]|uniref:G patch domain-containing protein 1 homolog n=1 Tax=Phlebotomus argentipes TaxID=94469 RepID=UPI002892A8B7|nr:G patch domain-containing protein 1 homolog [Phlebotomus argentipes]
MDDENELCRYGTPLDPIEEDQVPSKKPITKEDQIAVDANGRRRFHGAFTGGFSAGFWNTVGSLEGWKPQTFKSSRREKAEKVVQSIEDFMDSEDTGEFGIAPQRIQAQDDFAAGSGQKRTHSVAFASNAEGVLQKLMTPSRDNIGTRLLRKMGWREGQGVGVRLSRRAKKQAQRQHRKEQQLARRYGCDVGPLNVAQSEEESSSGDSDCEVTFAPDDFDTFTVSPKDNVFGLGYSGLARTPVLAKQRQNADTFAVMGKNNRKMMISGKGFGVGALEDEDDDIYTRDDMTQYDFSLEDQKKPTNSRMRQDRVQLGVLEGFIATQDAASGKFSTRIFRIDLPRDFQPKNFLVRRSRFAPLPPEVEQQLKEKPKSDKKSLSDSSERSKAPEVVPATPRQHKLFAYDSAKQERFEKFLLVSKDASEETIKDFFRDNQPLHVAQFDRQTEQREFLQARRMHKPLADLMSDRFVSEGAPEQVQEAPEEPPAKTEGPEERSFYSRRVKTTWKPDPLLCKRFNVPEPFGGTLEKEKKSKNRKSSNIFECLRDPMSQRIDFTASKNQEMPKEEVKMVESVQPVIVQQKKVEIPREEVKEAKEAPPPIKRQKNELEMAVLEAKDKHPADKKDLFRAIFEDSDESEDEKEEAPPPPPKEDVNPLRNPSEPKGIFSKILFVRQAAEKKKEEQQKVIQEVQEEDRTEDAEEEVFGPKLPPKVSQPSRIVRSFESAEKEKRKKEKWVEKEEIERKKRKKEKHKKEKKSKKSKKKHKSRD